MRILVLLPLLLLPSAAIALEGFSTSKSGNTAVTYWSLRDSPNGPLNYVHVVNTSRLIDSTVHVALYERDPTGAGCREILDFFLCVSREGGEILDLNSFGPGGGSPISLLERSGVLILTAYAVDEGLECGARPITFTHLDDILYAEITHARISSGAAGGASAFMFGLDALGQPNLPDAYEVASRFLTFNPLNLSPGSEAFVVTLEENAGFLAGVNEIGPMNGAICASSRFSSNDDVPTSLPERRAECDGAFPLDHDTHYAICNAGRPECALGFLTINQAGQFIQENLRVARGAETCRDATEPLGFTTFGAGWRFMIQEKYFGEPSGYGSLEVIAPTLAEVPPPPSSRPRLQRRPPTPTPAPTSTTSHTPAP